MLEWIGQHGYFFMVACWLLVLSSIASNILARRRTPPLHPPFTPDQVLFEEKRASGASDLNWFSRNGGARNALEVTVLSDGLLIEPIAPVKWLMRRNFNDLEHFIPTSDVLNVEHPGTRGRESVSVEFRGQDGATRKLLLRLRRQEAFLDAMARMRAA